MESAKREGQPSPAMPESPVGDEEEPLHSYQVVEGTDKLHVGRKRPPPLMPPGDVPEGAAGKEGKEPKSAVLRAELRRKNREMPLTTVMLSFRRDVERAGASRQLPCFVFFLFVITLVPWMSRLSSDRYNELFHLEQATRTELHLDDFKFVRDRDQFWSWLRGVSNSLWDLDRGNISTSSRLTAVSNLPVGVILMRQFRVDLANCTMPSIITNDFAKAMPDTCAGEWDDAAYSRVPFGPNNMFLPNSMTAKPINVLAVTTAFHTYDNDAETYSVVLSPFDSLETVLANISELETAVWLDHATRVVIVDICTYNPAVRAFALNHIYVEFFATGSTEAGVKAYPFDLVHHNSFTGWLLFISDVIVAAGIGVLILLIAFSVRNRRRLQYLFPVGLWDLYDLIFMIVLIYQTYYRMRVWSEGPALQNDIDPEMNEVDVFVKLFEYGYHFERANTFVGLGVIFAWLRLFKYLQYNAKLGVLSQTLDYAKNDLLSMLIIFGVVLVGYGVGGSALYGVDFKQFSTWYVGMSYLMRLVISAEINQDYETLQETHPFTTGIYIGTFMVITWMILLNMVLAIITGAFVTVQHNVHSRQTDQHVAGELGRAFRRVIHGCQRQGPFALCKSQRRLQALRVLQDWSLRRELEDGLKVGEQFITFEEFRVALADIYNEDEANRLFDKALSKAAATRGAEFKVSERFASQVNFTLDRLREQARNTDKRLGSLGKHLGKDLMESDSDSPGEASARPSPARNRKNTNVFSSMRGKLRKMNRASRSLHPLKLSLVESEVDPPLQPRVPTPPVKMLTPATVTDDENDRGCSDFMAAQDMMDMLRQLMEQQAKASAELGALLTGQQQQASRLEEVVRKQQEQDQKLGELAARAPPAPPPPPLPPLPSPPPPAARSPPERRPAPLPDLHPATATPASTLQPLDSSCGSATQQLKRALATLPRGESADSAPAPALRPPAAVAAPRQQATQSEESAVSTVAELQVHSPCDPPARPPPARPPSDPPARPPQSDGNAANARPPPAAPAEPRQSDDAVPRAPKQPVRPGTPPRPFRADEKRRRNVDLYRLLKEGTLSPPSPPHARRGSGPLPVSPLQPPLRPRAHSAAEVQGVPPLQVPVLPVLSPESSPPAESELLLRVWGGRGTALPPTIRSTHPDPAPDTPEERRSLHSPEPVRRRRVRRRRKTGSGARGRRGSASSGGSRDVVP
eukprot:TRINITY_DN2263_c0_g1_i4.p1 TRINITY_DN2263_c0_g1~~TRINITY_DN2263_c0_g1_i4.p1  ORF type:complete len:1215 (+),score=361.20 TRINITY_DN2263_c0_g1_i4:41-3646(+)